MLVQPTGSDVRPFQLTVEKLENSFKEAKKEVIIIFYLNIQCTRLKLTLYDSLKIVLFIQGLNIKALILLNPHNPLGEVYSSEEMISFLEFAKMWV